MNGEWAAGNGQWAVGNGQVFVGTRGWAMGRWSLACGNGHWAMSNGQVVMGMWGMGTGLVFMDKRLRRGECALGIVEHAWATDSGLHQRRAM